GTQRFTEEIKTYLPKRTVMRDPAATRAPGWGDCSWAVPLPMASRSSPASCAASMATRRFLPRNDGTSIPPSSTSRTTVPPAGNFCAGEFSGCVAGELAVVLAAAVVDALCADLSGSRPVRAAGTTWAAIVPGLTAAGMAGVSLASAISRLAPRGFGRLFFPLFLWHARPAPQNRPVWG